MRFVVTANVQLDPDGRPDDKTVKHAAREALLIFLDGSSVSSSEGYVTFAKRDISQGKVVR